MALYGVLVQNIATEDDVIRAIWTCVGYTVLLCFPTGITQNVKDLLSSREVENIFENSDFVYMLNQAGGDRQILAKQLGISPHQLSYVTHSGEGEGLLFYGSTILPFVDHFPKNTELYRIMTTKPQEIKEAD